MVLELLFTEILLREGTCTLLLRTWHFSPLLSFYAGRKQKGKMEFIGLKIIFLALDGHYSKLQCLLLLDLELMVCWRRDEFLSKEQKITLPLKLLWYYFCLHPSLSSLPLFLVRGVSKRTGNCWVWWSLQLLQWISC